MNLAAVFRTIRSHLSPVLLTATAFGFVAIGWVVNGRVMYLDLMPGILAGFFLAWIVGLAVQWTTRTIRPGIAVIAIAIAIVLASAGWFLGLWTNNTHWHDREQTRYFIGDHYNELTQQYIKLLGKEPPIDSLLDDNACDPRTIYDDLSSVQLKFQAAWCAMAMSAAVVVVLLGAAAERERIDALLVRVKTRVDAWPKAMPTEVTLKMRQAMDALTASSVPNVRGCVSTLYSVFADDAGLLRKLFSVYRPGPEGDKAWKKFGNFVDQIENVNKLGLLRSDIYSDLHYVRCSENSGKHRGLDAFELATLTMNHAVRIVEWWAFQSKYGPHLPNPPRDLADITDPRTDGPNEH